MPLQETRGQTAKLNIYGCRISELDSDIDAALAAGDTVSADTARAERESIVERLKGVKDLRGRARKASDDRERVRKGVTNAIGRTIEDIQAFDPALAEHLTVHVNRGSDCIYTAPAGVVWAT